MTRKFALCRFPITEGPLADWLPLLELLPYVPFFAYCFLEASHGLEEGVVLLSRENVRVGCRVILSVELYFPGKTGDVSRCCSRFPVPELPAGRRVRQRGYAVPHG